MCHKIVIEILEQGYMDQNSPKINPYTYRQLIFLTSAPTQFSEGENSAFNGWGWNS
jgi:hypothetical protein